MIDQHGHFLAETDLRWFIDVFGIRSTFDHQRRCFDSIIIGDRSEEIVEIPFVFSRQRRRQTDIEEDNGRFVWLLLVETNKNIPRMKISMNLQIRHTFNLHLSVASTYEIIHEEHFQIGIDTEIG